MFPVNVGVNPLTLRQTRGYAYLLRVTLPQEAASFEAYDVVYPAASFGHSTAPDDIPANTYVPGLLLGSTINYAVSLFDGIEPEASSSGGQGAIVLVDTRGELDELALRDGWDGAQLDILQGPPANKFKTYGIVGKLTTAGILYSQRRKEIRLRDQSWKLQQAGLHDQIYGGTGDADGDAALKGQYKPYGCGPIYNATPTLVDGARQIYQLTCSSMHALDEVRDGGLALTPTGTDYPDYASMAAAADATAIPAGQYATCKALGMFVTGSRPALLLTADFRGDADVISGSGYPDTLATIARRLVVGRGNVVFADADLDFSTLNALDQVQPDTSGWWWPGGSSQPTKAEALQEIMGGRLGWWAVRLNGQLAFGVMNEPSGPPNMILDYPEDFAAEPEQLDTYQVPRHASYVGYRRNYTPQDASQLAGALDAATVALYGLDSFYASSTNTTPLWRNPTARTVRVQSGLAEETPAVIEALRQQTVMGTRRERWTVSVPCDAFSNVLGKVVQINGFPRYSFGASRKFVCIGMSFASGIAVKLTLWG